MRFVATGRAGMKSCHLNSTTDWQLEVNLGKQLKFPARITSTRLVIYTRRCTEYQELVDKSWKQGWKTRSELREVGCQRLAERSVCKVFTMMGLTGETKRNAIISATEGAEKDTRWRWKKRADPFERAAGIEDGA